MKLRGHSESHYKNLDLKILAPILKKFCSKTKERSSLFSSDQSEIVYEVVLKNFSTQDLIQEIGALRGIQKTVMVSYEGDLDEPR